MFHLSLRILWLTCCIYLTGCGNAYERISMGEWSEVGKPEPPVGKFSGDFIVETRVQGDGPIVKAGDLVKVRLSVTTAPDNLPSMISPEFHIAWLWVGREPGRDFDEEYLGTFGGLGSARVRRALIGRRLHEKFEIHLEKGAEGSTDAIPLRGIFDHIIGRLRTSSRVDGKVVRVPEWAKIELVDDWGGIASANIEILGVCNAKLLQRTAMLQQWGIIVAFGDTKYRSIRKGILGWTAIDAQCPAPDGQIRLQAGPFYYAGPRHPPDILADWEKSYVRLRPPQEFPEEWKEVALK